MNCDALCIFTAMEKYNWKIKWGIALIVLACVLFLLIPVVPFLSVDGKTKITISTVLFVLGVITFWGGGLLVGKELFTKYKAYLNPKNWFKKKQGLDES
jgi:hypothetical protein